MKNASITIILNEKRDQVLLVKRVDMPVWVLPGGGIDYLEKPEDAAIRETFEETGLVVNLKRKTGEYTPINRLASHTHVFEGQISGGHLQTGDETKEIGFFPIDQLPKSFFIIHKDWLNDALNNQEIVKKHLVQVTYFNLFIYFLKHPYLVIKALLARF